VVNVLVRILYLLMMIVVKAERRASESKQEYEQVSKLVKIEVARFEQERIEDFKDSLHAFLEGMISRQKEVRGFQLLYWYCSYIYMIVVDRGLGELPTDAFEESKWGWGYGCANVRILYGFSMIDDNWNNKYFLIV
jgi:hypothetical protein